MYINVFCILLSICIAWVVKHFLFVKRFYGKHLFSSRVLTILSSPGVLSTANR